MLLDPLTLAAVAALGFVAAVVGGIGGFGTGIILATALVPLMGVKAVCDRIDHLKPIGELLGT